MRKIGMAAIAALGAMMTCGAAQADIVPPFKGNDTGGIIAFELTRQTDPRLLASAHCAQYGKVVKWLALQNYYGGYASFACRWPRPGRLEQPLRVRY